jgi:hypothetical protein
MTAVEPWVFRWPQMPPLPPPGQPVVIGPIAGGSRELRREDSRDVLRHVLVAWSGCPEHVIPVRETPRGPVWEGNLAGHSLGVSISYCENQAWIGLLRGGTIGLDAMRPTDFAELKSVARLYLGPAAWKRIEQSNDRALAFAAAWTELEARAKCLNRPIVEVVQRGHRVLRPADGVEAAARHCVVGGSVIAIVTVQNGLPSRTETMMPPPSSRNMIPATNSARS